MDDIMSSASSEVTVIRTLEEFAQGIDPTSAQYESYSIVDILRKHVTVDNTATDKSINIEYGIVPRKGGSTLECHITFVVEGLQVVNGRT
jgi:hypothetical protein